MCSTRHSAQHIVTPRQMIDSIIIFIHAVIIITFRGIIFQCWIGALEVFFLPSYRKIWFQDVIWQNKCSISHNSS